MGRCSIHVSVSRRFGVVYKVKRILKGFNSVCGRWVRKRFKSHGWVLGGLGVDKHMVLRGCGVSNVGSMNIIRNSIGLRGSGEETIRF